ncbi:MAG: S9 family peptidase [Ignavibacteriae bacterium]|nr:S9 family peptidase [Ignavibacteriota bacterium]
MKKFSIIFFGIISFILFSDAQDKARPINPDIDPPIEFYTPYLRKLPDALVKSLTDTTSTGILEFLMTNLPDAEKRELKSKINDYHMSRVPEAKKKSMTPEILLSLERISDPQISPDGKWVLYTKTIPKYLENKSYKDLYVVSIDGKWNIQITSDPAADYNGRWSPNGKKIYYISKSTGKPQINIIDVPDTNKLLTTNTRGVWRMLPNVTPSFPFIVENGVDNLSWSPDGKYFAFTSDFKLDSTLKEKNPDLPEANARVFNNLPIRHWDEWEDENYNHLFIREFHQEGPSDFKQPVDLMQGERFETPVKPFGGIEQIAWSPDGKEIAYTSKKVNNYVQTTNTDIYIVPIAGGETKNITKDLKGSDSDPLYSPDGKWIAFHSQEHDGFESDRIRLMLYNRSNGDIKELSKSLDQWVGHIIWAPDSKSIYFAAEDKATVQIYQMQIEDGSWKIITSGRYNFEGGLDITKDGKTLVCGRRDMTRPHEFYAIEMKGETPLYFQLTDVNSFYFNNLAKINIEEKWFQSNDGKKFQSWVLYPPYFDSTKKYPMITYCQGGPQSTVSQFFSFRWNLFLMASQGYVVVAPNRRGLPGFGQEWNNAISKDWGGKAMEDILTATDEMLKEPYINKKHVAAVGASAGGYAVFWLEGNHKKRFCAFVSHCGVFNFESMYGSTEELWFPDWEFGGPYWNKENKEIYDKNSPHEFALNWDTPIMISTGEKDFRVPYTQSLEAFTLAQVKGIPSKLVIFPEGNHWIEGLQDALLWQREFFSFLDTYCKPKEPENEK